MNIVHPTNIYIYMHAYVDVLYHIFKIRCESFLLFFLFTSNTCVFVNADRLRLGRETQSAMHTRVPHEKVPKASPNNPKATSGFERTFPRPASSSHPFKLTHRLSEVVKEEGSPRRIPTRPTKEKKSEKLDAAATADRRSFHHEASNSNRRSCSNDCSSSSSSSSSANSSNSDNKDKAGSMGGPIVHILSPIPETSSTRRTASAANAKTPKSAACTCLVQ